MSAEKSGVVIKTGSEVISATAQGELQFAALGGARRPIS
jgi:hypothetical protein